MALRSFNPAFGPLSGSESHVRKILVAAAVTAAALSPVVVASEAQATTAFNLTTNGVPGGGYGSSVGSITWETAKRAVVTARVTDWCPGDGYGAYLLARVTYGNGSQRTELLWGDNDGCNNSPSPQYGHGVPNPENRNISSVQLQTCYSNGQPGGWADCVRNSTSGVITS